MPPLNQNLGSATGCYCAFFFNLLEVEIEIDARVLFGRVTEEYNGNLYHASLIMDCMTLINLIPLAKMSYYFCEANKCTNALARRDSSSN